jgi:hypothetical protein
VAAADTDEAGRYAIEGLADVEHIAVATGYSPTASMLHVTVWAPAAGRAELQPAAALPAAL